MIRQLVRFLGATTCALGICSIVPMFDEKAIAQTPGFQGRFRPSGYQNPTRPSPLRPGDLAAQQGGQLGGGQLGQGGGGQQFGGGGQQFGGGGQQFGGGGQQFGGGGFGQGGGGFGQGGGGFGQGGGGFGQGGGGFGQGGGGFGQGLGLISGLAVVAEAERWSVATLERTKELATSALAVLESGSALIRTDTGWEVVGAATVEGSLPPP